MIRNSFRARARFRTSPNKAARISVLLVAFYFGSARGRDCLDAACSGTQCLITLELCVLERVHSVFRSCLRSEGDSAGFLKGDMEIGQDSGSSMAYALELAMAVGKALGLGHIQVPADAASIVSEASKGVSEVSSTTVGASASATTASGSAEADSTPSKQAQQAVLRWARDKAAKIRDAMDSWMTQVIDAQAELRNTKAKITKMREDVLQDPPDQSLVAQFKEYVDVLDSRCTVLDGLLNDGGVNLKALATEARDFPHFKELMDIASLQEEAKRFNSDGNLICSPRAACDVQSVEIDRFRGRRLRTD